MKIKEQQLTDVVIGIKCDICNKELPINNLNKFTSVICSGGDWMGCSSYTNERDVCSCKCFIELLKKINSNWEQIVEIKNGDILRQTINKI
jgi:hypothetical protein